MKKKYLISAALMSCLLFYVGGDYIFSASASEDQLIDEIFESDLYDTTAEKYGVTSMGVGKREKILSVRIEEKNINNEKEAKQYFENHLASLGINDYKVEILIQWNTEKC